jgi:hypothetical protein
LKPGKLFTVGIIERDRFGEDKTKTGELEYEMETDSYEEAAEHAERLRRLAICEGRTLRIMNFALFGGGIHDEVIK